MVTGMGPDPSAGTSVGVFSYDGSSVSTLATMESFSGMTGGATVAAGRF